MLIRYLGKLFVLLALAGCASAPDELSDDIVVVPEIADDIANIVNDVSSENKSPTIEVPNGDRFNLWWRYTGSKELEWLIDRALTNSQTLQIAAQRIVQARALATQSDASGMPSVTAQATADRNAPSGGVGSVPRGSLPQAQTAYEVGLSGQYTLDLWGQREALSRSSHLKLKRAVFEYDAQRLALISELARNYFQYLSLNDRIRNARDSEQALVDMSQAMQERYDQGDATIVEKEIQRSAIFSSRAVLPTLLKDRKQLEFSIARLVGVAPGRISLSEDGLDSIAMPEAVNGLSTAYILRRPDIRAIESAMLAADADLDVARKALLPGLTLSADISSAARNPADLFQPNTLIWGMLGTLSASVFDGGSQEQGIKLAQSLRNELVESYANTVYNSLSAARIALTELEFSGERLSMQQQSAQAAGIAQEFGFQSYSVGGIDFLTYMDSMQSYQQRQDTMHQVQLEYYLAFVDFYASLGGGIPYRSLADTHPVFKEGVDSVSTTSGVAGESDHAKGDGWLDEPRTFSQSPWLVKIAGVYDRFAIEALLRDMPRRYDSLKPAQEVFVEVVDVFLNDAGQDAEWLSVNFSGFESETAAQKWCSVLRDQQQRCVVYQPEENFKYIARFGVGSIEALSHRKGESLHARQLKVLEESSDSHLTPDGIPYGTLYSLLKTDAEYAWLIGNRSYHVWRFPIGARLAYGGKLKHIEPNQVVVSYKGRDYLLRPLYTIEEVTSGSGGQVFAKMRWGGNSGDIYYHRTGERLYGGGIIKSINAERAVVNWKGAQVLLPVQQR